MPIEPIKETTPAQEEKGYFMTYRHGMSPYNFKGFKHKGDLKSARNRAFKHGQIMGYKNIWVSPQFVDLTLEEKSYDGTGEVQPGSEQGAMIRS